MSKVTGCLRGKRLFLLDMDGTLYLGDRLFDGTLDFLQRVRQIGGRYLFLTNNSSRGADAYVEKLGRLGIPSAPEDFFTSTDATILYIQRHFPGARVYSFGTASFTAQLRAAGIEAVTSLCEGIDLLLLSNDTELTFQKLEDASILLGRGVAYLATNPDWVCPTSYGYVPDCGSFAEMLYRATGRRPQFIGKPQPEMVTVARERLGFSREETVMIGDRVYTDVAAGCRAGVDTVLVLSGEGTRADAAAAEQPPTYVMQDIREVLANL